MSDVQVPNEPKQSWLGAGLLLTAIGSMGPANFYFLVTDPHYLDKFQGWKLLMLPAGAWILCGLLLNGLTVIWFGGVKRLPDWQKRGEKAWEWWSKLGLWLIAIGIGLAVAAWAFSGLADFLSKVDRGTAIIAGLLFMILIALWRIGDQMRGRS